MRKTIHVDNPPSPLEVKSALKVVIAYDEYTCGLRAFELYQRVTRAQSDLQFLLNIWKFEPLGLPQLCVKAARQASEAELIIVSLRADRSIPIEAKEWTQSWRRSRDRGALVLALNATAHELHPTRAYFEYVANRANREFFCALLQEAESVPHTLPGSLGIGFDRDWGLND